ncbi:ABC transporter ATP-binding protein [Spiroplasma sp. TIUS-1]|uniref:ATP-binding cassette domain-containing protein n=1 Tax=Spiroplasma sp. TIUS-1 TaxID=216963 RepID=UPI00139841DF|nr:ABC transporter ATP-binding protein [Spiroplasma sp. TIUS-1]QHX35728.1 ABC transporter ATP-binding protein [Spiroplasma sp. TIUS-1]
MEFKFKNFTKLFKNGKGIENINIDVKSGEILGLIGDNGSGKSTFIKSIFGEYTRQTGEIIIDNKIIDKSDLGTFSLFPDQSIYPQNISIFEFIKYTLKLSGANKKTIKKSVIEALENVNLIDYKNKTFKELSAGMQKRALLANALITNPIILFLDEPTANLDVKTRIQFLEILSDLAKVGIAIVITSHLIDELANLVDKLAILDNGKLTYCDYTNNDEESIKDLYIKYSENITGSINVSKFVKNKFEND